MKAENILEVIVGTLIVIIIAVLLIPKEEVTNKPVIIEDTFNQYVKLNKKIPETKR